MQQTLNTFEEEDLFSTLLRYGLFVGAVFQLACIGACIFLPSSESKNLDNASEESLNQDCGHNSSKRQHLKARKQEKKKRR